jgi:ferredoxin
MPLFKSFVYNMKEANYIPIKIMHGMLYGPTVTYLRFLKHLLKMDSPSFRELMSETNQGEVLRPDDALKFISVNKYIDFEKLDKVLPYKYVREIVLKNPQNIIAYECACRAQKKDACKPTDVCLIVGDPFVDLIRMVQLFRYRRITQEEALKILKEENERGHIHTAWFNEALVDRFYAICNCCKCCCLGIKSIFKYKIYFLLPSGYLAVISDNCDGCGECEKYCQFNAIEIMKISENGKEEKRCRIKADKCYGCGVCETKCRKDGISLILDPNKGVPLGIYEL